jgi:hypothetical protein
MTPQEISMVIECTSSYVASDHPDGSLTITIEVPSRFAELWLVKLSDLRATADDVTFDNPE